MEISKRFIPLTVFWGIGIGESFLYLVGSTGMIFNRLGLDLLEATAVVLVLTVTATVFYFVFKIFDWRGAFIVPPIGATMNMSFFRLPRISTIDAFYSNTILLAVFWSFVLIPPYFVTKKLFHEISETETTEKSQPCL